MIQPVAPTQRLQPEPLPANLCSVQPGGGVCYRIELAWGRWRRWYLKKLRSRYVADGESAEGRSERRPHEILDPRDLKYCRNLCDCRWDPADDPFTWRERIPFARWGLAELQLMGYPLLAAAVALALTEFWYMTVVPGVILGLIIYFFRDPPRRVPVEPGLLVAPADGKITEITELEHDDFIGGPAVRIGIFLSIFNVHLNRAPCRARVIRLVYSPGKFLNVLNPASVFENEYLRISLEEADEPHRRLIVRQIAGMFARRIVCGLRPGEVVERGSCFGMIKLGSRTEMILPRDETLRIETRIGQKVKAGATILARWSHLTH